MQQASCTVRPWLRSPARAVWVSDAPVVGECRRRSSERDPLTDHSPASSLVLRSAVEVTKLDLPAEAAELVDDQQLAEETFVMWDLIHDRTHMRGDLPFDPFMIKQRMPFFLYSLEELPGGIEDYPVVVDLLRWANPLTPPLYALRDPLFYGVVPDWKDVVYLVGVAAGSLLLGAWVFSRVDDRIAVEL